MLWSKSNPIGINLMSLTTGEIKKLANLSRLALSEEDCTKLSDQLSNILNLVTKMDAVNTKEVAPMSHPLDVHQPLRPDVVTEKNQRDLFLSIAPLTAEGLYLVPKVIE
jgi:aspartyl-tRNA(Asn)/glutamyl-tRNA(Gln) amidotransferase subunit C